MGVKVTFTNGNVRTFDDATDAIKSGIFLAVTKDSTEIHRFDFADVIEAVVDKGSGPKVVRGGGKKD